MALRDDVLSGRFFGKGAGASAEAFAGSLAHGDRRALLREWFGDPFVAGLRDEPDRAGAFRAAVDRDIVTLDLMISRQLDAVLQHRRLARLEGSWRGLAWLIGTIPPAAGRCRVRLLQVTWKEICRDIERAVEFDQSNLFRKIYEEQFGMAGGEPFGLIAADFEIQHRPDPDHPTDDVGALSGLAGIAAAAFAPILLGASPKLFGVSDYGEVSTQFNFSSSLQTPEHARLRTAAAHDDFRFLGIALPRTLARPPWPDDGTRPDRFRYRGYAPKAAQRPWSSPVYAFAGVAVRAFERYSWPADVRGADISEVAGGGVIEDLPFEPMLSDLVGESPPRAPLELTLTDEQERQLSQSGLIPLAAIEGLCEICFSALPSLHRPRRMTSAIADANQLLSTQINTILCVSRFAHCVKIMGREMIGSYREPQEVERILQRWLSGYISGFGTGGAEVTAKFPLLDASVEVRENPGKPGVYSCVIYLKPHHQLDEVGADFRFIAEFVPNQNAA